MPLTAQQFAEFVSAGHALFNLFEARWDFHPAAARAASDWLATETFEIAGDTASRVAVWSQGADEAFGIRRGQEHDRFVACVAHLADALRSQPRQNIGLGLAPYFFTWNARRFIEYLRKKKDFDAVAYFQRFGDFLVTSRRKLSRASRLELLSEAGPPDDSLWDSIHELLKTLGINQNEPVGTIKILHIFAPRYFPLLDNRIAEAFHLKQIREPITKAVYFGTWLPKVRGWLGSFGDAPMRLEREMGGSILKLIDEAFYVISSIDLSRRAGELGV